MSQIGPYSGTVGPVTGEITVDLGKYVHSYSRAELRYLITFREAAKGDELFAEATIHAPQYSLEADETHICESADANNEGALDFLVTNGLVTDTGKRVASKYGELVVAKLTAELLGVR